MAPSSRMTVRHAGETWQEERGSWSHFGHRKQEFRTPVLNSSSQSRTSGHGMRCPHEGGSLHLTPLDTLSQTCPDVCFCGHPKPHQVDKINLHGQAKNEGTVGRTEILSPSLKISFLHSLESPSHAEGSTPCTHGGIDS